MWKRVVDGALAVGLGVPGVQALAQRLARRLDGEVDDGGGAAPGGGPGAGLEGVGGEGAAERQLHVGVGVDAARDDVLPGGVDGAVGRPGLGARGAVRGEGGDRPSSIRTSAWISSAAVMTRPPRIRVRSWRCTTSSCDSRRHRRLARRPPARQRRRAAGPRPLPPRRRSATAAGRCAARWCRARRPCRSAARAAGGLQHGGAAGRGFASSVPGLTSSMPIIRPRPRTSRTPGSVGRDGPQPLDEQAADPRGRCPGGRVPAGTRGWRGPPPW